MSLQKSYPYIAAFLIMLHINPIQAAAEESFPIAWGVSARQGRRHTMEDAHTTVLKFKSDDAQAFFAIYDGHGGKQAARVAACKTARTTPLHTFLADSTADSLVEQYKEAFQKTENMILAYDDSGTTAVTAHVNTATKTITFAHVGDSRALLIRNDTIAATVDHKPLAPSEMTRIFAAGGMIQMCGRTAYLNSMTSVSRALGDREEKNPRFKGLIATPEISTASYTDDENTVLVLGCDGVWDVFSNEEAAVIVTNALNADPIEHSPLLNGELVEINGNNAAAICAARTLRDRAYKRGSLDNISVMIALLHKVAGKPFATEFVKAEPFQKLYDAPVEPTSMMTTSDTDSNSSSQ
jgi:serine/threonine protein phosphatase PrpC